MKQKQQAEILAELGDEIPKKEQELQEKKDELKSLENEDEDKHEEYDDMLDDVGIENILKDYLANEILKKIDEVRYDMGYDEYIDNQISDLEYEKKELESELNKLKEQEK